MMREFVSEELKLMVIGGGTTSAGGGTGASLSIARCKLVVLILDLLGCDIRSAA